MKRIFIFILTLLFLVNVSFSAYFYNSTYENLTYDTTGWCPTLEITFTIFNVSEYDRQKEIEDDLCDDSKNETPEDDNCEIFQDLSGLEYVIYDGPFEYSPVLVQGTLDENNQFKVNFPEIDQYLFELPPNSKEGSLSGRGFNDFYEILQIIDCPWLEKSFENTNESLTGINRSEVLESLAPKRRDIVFTYDSIVELDFKNTTINKSNEAIVIEINNFTKKNLPELENIVKTVEVVLNNEDYSSMTIKILESLNDSETRENKVLKYNSALNSWEDFVDLNSTEIIINSASQGIYSVVSTQIEVVEPELNITQSEVQDEENGEEIIENEINDGIPVSSSTASNDLIKKIGMGVGVIVLLLVVIYFIFSHKKSAKHYHEYRTVDNYKVEVDPNAKVLENMSEAKKRSVDYVQKYKSDYSKDQIYRALKAANIPGDVIDEVFKEEF